MNSGDNFVTGVVSAQKVTANIINTGVGSFQRSNVESIFSAASGANLLLGILIANVGSARGTIGMLDTTVGGFAPGSGDISNGGWLYVQSGGLHFMGAQGTVTIVGSA
jgi:hypothetical protein